METDMDKLRKDLDDRGFLVLNEVLDEDALSLYCGLYEDFMSGKLDASDHRHDLGSHNEPKIKGRENITQIMWPSLYFDKASRPINGIHNSSLHVQAEAIAKAQCQTFYIAKKKAFSGQKRHIRVGKSQEGTVPNLAKFYSGILF